MIVKICGIRTTEAAVAAAEAHADLLGFNFALASRRRVETEAAREAIDALRALELPHAPRAVGVFVNQPVGEVSRIANDLALDFIQLSGHENADYCRAAVSQTGRPVIKAIRIGVEDGTGTPDSLVSEGGVSIFLVDAPVAGSYGGSGQPWRWQDASEIAARHHVLLAGGLTPENVGEAAAAAHPWGVDVATGVETQGQTDPEKVRAFITQVRAYEHSHPAN